LQTAIIKSNSVLNGYKAALHAALDSELIGTRAISRRWQRTVQYQ